ncbi:MAG TPA: NAD(+) synthase, partial [Caulobacteraceae bacterium]|nr:NAD(+) synthase [Caulobacteraceae bacterium]
MSQRPFDCLYSHAFARVGAAVPRVEPADPGFNVDATLALAARGDEAHAAVMVFPELGVSAYALDELLFQDAVLDAVEAGIGRIAEASRKLFPVLIVGAPLRRAGRLYNSAVVIHRGRILGVVPKTYLPNYREFYERRYFTSGAGERGGEITVAGQGAPFGVDLLFRSQGELPLTFHVEICEDLWTPIPPSSAAALAGAEVLINLSASNITIGKAETRRLLCAGQSRAAVAAYVYTAAGPGESTTDLAWDGQAGVFELGQPLAETRRFEGDQVAFADIDLGRIRQERMRLNTFGDCANEERERTSHFRFIEVPLERPKQPVALDRPIERFPFVPSDAARLKEDCYEAYNIQIQGLAKRLEATGVKHAVIGVSGGLDSTQALIVAARAMDRLGLPRSNVLAYSLPGFATSDATRANALALMKSLGVTSGEVDIRPAATQMLADMGHPFSKGEKVYDVTFENVQAGLRTDYLFRLANQHGGLVVGTGDLSELALGWCTYGVGDQMSHYNVNAGVPKTLIQHLIRWVISARQFAPDVLATLEATGVKHAVIGVSGGLDSTQALIVAARA